MPSKIWISALLLSFSFFIILLLLAVPVIFLVLLTLVLALGSAALTKLFISNSEDQSMLEHWLFVFITSFFIFSTCLLVKGDLSVALPLVLVYGFGLFIFNSIKSFVLYIMIAIIALVFQLWWLGNGFGVLSYSSVWGYLAISFSMLLFIFMYNHDFKVRQKAFHLLNDQLTLYHQSQIEERIDEYIIYTNESLEITAVSHPAQNTLFNFHSTVVGKKLFSVLYLKDESGVLIGNNNQLMLDLVAKQERVTLEKLTLILPNTAKQYAAILSVHPSISLAGQVEQIEFRLRVPGLTCTTNTVPLFEPQKMAFYGLIAMLKTQIEDQKVANSLFFTELIDRGFKNLTFIEDWKSGVKPQTTLVDSAQLMRNIITREQIFAGLLKEYLVIEVVKQHDKKEDPLFPQTMNGSVHELTGPFYTVRTDASLFDHLHTTLIFCLLALGAYEKDRKISITVNSDSKYVSIVYALSLGADAQRLLKKFFDSSERPLNVGEVPYTLGIESIVLHQLVGLLEGQIDFEIGSESIVRVQFNRYVSKNNQVSTIGE